MWDLLFVSVLAGALFLYVPGFVLGWSFGIPRIVSLIYAPIVSSVVYSMLGIIYAKLGIPCSWFALAVPTLVVALIVFVVVRLVVKVPDLEMGLGGSPASFSSWVTRHLDELCLAFYVVVGLGVAAWFLLGSMGNANAFSQEYDNVHHLGMTKAFLDSGDWSCFSSSSYATSEDAAINPLPGSGFYPAAWNVLAALIASASGAPLAVASNALNYLFIALVFPSSMFLFMRWVFRDHLTMVPCGAVCVLAFMAFPWGFLAFGPLYPNMIAFAVMPAVAFCFVALFSKNLGGGERLALIVLLCFGLVGFVFMQPNAVFSLGVFLIPFCVYQAVILIGASPTSSKVRAVAKVLVPFGMVACMAALWYAAYRTPALQGVVTHPWPSFEPFSQSFLHALTLSFQSGCPQIILMILVIIGAAYTLYDRRYTWMTCSYALACALYMVDASMDGPIKLLLTGFWYNDSNRVAAFATIFAIPLASIGLWFFFKVIYRMGSLVIEKNKARGILSACASLVVCLAFFYFNFSLSRAGVSVPDDFRPSSGGLADSMKQTYDSPGPRVYDDDEIAFVEEVKRTIPDDALVINMPDDGSVFSYGIDGLRVYYRYLRTYGGTDETEPSKEIRNHLDRIGSDPNVQEAVRSIGAHYVLLLDQGPEITPRRYLFTYENGRNWRGMTSISDDTPGLNVVLARGDMRLYSISAL